MKLYSEIFGRVWTSDHGSRTFYVRRQDKPGGWESVELPAWMGDILALVPQPALNQLIIVCEELVFALYPTTEDDTEVPALGDLGVKLARWRTPDQPKIPFDPRNS